MSRSRAGDTIVEVLLAVAIVSAVLAGAYVATNRTVRANRAAQERSEALKVAETQTERLKYLKASPPMAIDLNNGVFCITNISPAAIVPVTNPSNEAGCTFNIRYVASISRDAATDTYTIRVLWPNVTGTSNVPGFPGFDELELYYRTEQ